MALFYRRVAGALQRQLTASRCISNHQNGDNSFLIEKLRRIYIKKDQDGNGCVQPDDFEIWAEKACEISGATFNDQVKGAWINAFEAHFGDAKNFEEWKDKQLDASNNMESFTEYALNVNKPLFEIVDADGNGTISFKEYTAFVKPLGASDEDCQVGFAAIDEDGNGELTYEEFNHAWVKYYFDKTDSKYKHFYGEFK